MWGLGMHMVAKSDLSTGNQHYASYVLQSKELVFTFTAPYKNTEQDKSTSKPPYPAYNQDSAHKFISGILYYSILLFNFKS